MTFIFTIHRLGTGLQFSKSKAKRTYECSTVLVWLPLPFQEEFLYSEAQLQTSIVMPVYIQFVLVVLRHKPYQIRIFTMETIRVCSNKKIE